MGFPFETITDEASRNRAMAKCLDYLLRDTKIETPEKDRPKNKKKRGNKTK
jgi:hypothetical protein